MNSVTNRVHLRRRPHSHKGGLRTVAVFEALKGLLGLLLAYVLISMIRRGVNFAHAAGRLLFLFHINPDRHWIQQLLHAAGKLSDASIPMITTIAIAYAALRFAEGYGLWRQRAWAEWLAIVSGCIYIPFEIDKVVRRPDEFHWAILGINILVVLYIAWVRWDEIKASQPPATPVPDATG